MIKIVCKVKGAQETVGVNKGKGYRATEQICRTYLYGEVVAPRQCSPPSENGQIARRKCGVNHLPRQVKKLRASKFSGLWAFKEARGHRAANLLAIE